MSDDRRHWLLDDPVLLDQVKRIAADYEPTFRDGDIFAHNLDPVVDQGIFAWGDPGTETGHALDTNSVDRTVALDGTGNYLAFLRVELDQTLTNNDQNQARTYKLQYRKNTVTWTDVPSPGSYTSQGVRAVADSNITDGAATSNRISGSAAAFLAGAFDEGDGVQPQITWSGGLEHTEMLWSLEFVDADLAATDLMEFRVIESGGTLLNNSASADFPGLTWNAASTEFTASETEAVTVGDSASRVAGAPRPLTDAVTVGEDIDTLTDYVLGAEAVVVGENITNVVSETVGPTDGVTVGDSVSASAGVLTSDGVTVGENIATVTGYALFSPEAVIVGDSAEYPVGPTEKAETEAVTVGDSPSTLAALNTAQLDAVTVGDSASTLAALNDSRTDAVTTGDSLLLGIGEPETDAVVVGDSVSTLASLNDSETDAVIVGENITNVVSETVGPTDAVTLGDSAAYSDNTRNVTDAVVVGENIATVTGYELFSPDAVTVGDSVAYSDNTRDLTDAVSVGEDIDTTTDYVLGAEAVTVGDSASYPSGDVAAVTDAVTVNDYPGTVVTADSGPEAVIVGDSAGYADTRSLSDAVTVGEDIDTAITQDSGPEGVTVGDSVVYESGDRSLSDGVAVGEDITNVVSETVGPIDAVTVGDTATITEGNAASVSDGVTTGEAIQTSTTADSGPEAVIVGDALAIAVALGLLDNVELDDLLSSGSSGGSELTDAVFVGSSVNALTGSSTLITDGVLVADYPVFARAAGQDLVEEVSRVNTLIERISILKMKSEKSSLINTSRGYISHL